MAGSYQDIPCLICGGRSEKQPNKILEQGVALCGSNACANSCRCVFCRAPCEGKVICSLCMRCSITSRTNVELTKAACRALEFLFDRGIVFVQTMINVQRRGLNLPPITSNNNYKFSPYTPDQYCCANGYRNGLRQKSRICAPFSTCCENGTLLSKDDYISLVLQAIPLRYMAQGEAIFNSNFHQLAKTTCVNSDGGRVHYVQGIHIMPATPFLRLVGTLVHEYLHAWIFLVRHSMGRGSEDTRCPPGSRGVTVEEAACYAASIYYWSIMAELNPRARPQLQVWAASVKQHHLFGSLVRDYLPLLTRHRSDWPKGLFLDIATHASSM